MFAKVSNIPYSNIHGILEAVQPLEEVKIETKIGSLIPVYEIEDMGRMRLTPVKIDKSGKIKSMQLQEATLINTSVGKISTEFITFYPSGHIRRLFPLNGKLSGYWSEQNEYDLAKEIALPTPIGIISVKPIYVHFYETGELQSVTFWPKERLEIKTPFGLVKVKTGISFYKSGKLKSFEPESEITLPTVLGNISSFDPDPMGINGEKNSLALNENGSIQALATIKSEVHVINIDGTESIYKPNVQASRCNDEIFVVLPLIIEFNTNEITFKHGFKTIGIASKDSIFTLKDFSTEKNTVCVSSCH